MYAKSVYMRCVDLLIDFVEKKYVRSVVRKNPELVYTKALWLLKTYGDNSEFEFNEDLVAECMLLKWRAKKNG